ncbi:hypothetical protein ACI65C_013319 [Semiaphis heraclei]
MSENINVCLCGRKRQKINDTNWKRHLTAYTPAPVCSSVTQLNLLNTGNTNTTVASLASINLVTNSIASCSQMDLVESPAMYGVCSDEDQSNELSTRNIKDTTKDEIVTTTSNYDSFVTQLNVLNTGNINTTVSSIDLVTNSIASYIGNIVEQGIMHFQQFPNDPSIILDSKMSTEQFAYVASLQPCQPKASELKGEDSKSYQLARFGSNDWNHISLKLKSHESNSSHLESEIRRALFVSNQREVSTIFETSNTNVAENREVAKLSLVIRFINENEEVEERLVALENVSDARGIGMFNVLCNICEKYDIDWENQLCAQSYNGASSMQGQYSGVRAYIQEKNPRAIYVWIFSHILNLVVVDTCDTSKTMRNFFGDLQSLIAFLRARKRTAIFLKHQKICYPDERVCRMKNFSSIRWTSDGRALTVIYEKYKALTNTLKELSNSTERDTSSMATNLMSAISSFKFVTHLLLMRNIFEYTTPLSMYLQSLSLDFITALTMVDNCAKNLSELRNELQSDILLAEAKRFSLENELEEVWFPDKRVQKRKKMAGEKTNDENRIDRLIATNKGCPIPKDNFVYIDNWIPNIQIDELKLEYATFAYNFLKFKSNTVIEKLHKDIIISESDGSTSADSDGDNNEETKTKMTVLNGALLLPVVKFLERCCCLVPVALSI